jgi:hypothetical protein
MSPDEAQVGPTSTNVRRFLTSATVLYFGIAIYVLSFFLPAVNPYDLGGIPGWACAWLSFGSIGEGVSWSALGFFGALINPIAITYVVLRIRNRAPHFRSVLATAILLFIPLTWLSLAFAQYKIEAGHIAWIAGLLSMISWSDLRYLLRLPYVTGTLTPDF